MIDLNEVQDSEYITEGEYVCQIVGIKQVRGNQNGTAGFEYTVQTASGLKGKFALWDTTKAHWITKRVAKACQLTEQEMRSFDYDMLHGRELVIVFKQNERGYGEASEFKAFAAKPEAPKPAPAKPAAAKPATKDDLPF